MKSTIIVPAYNESERILSFLTELIEYSKKNIKDSEILIVNDGSKDDTAEVVGKFIKNKKNTKLLSYNKNRGKGGAIQYGIQYAKGDKILFIDADGSIQPDQIPKMLDALDKNDVVVGDRLSKESKVEKSIIRKITSFGFNIVVSLIFQYSYRDNLCGFKGFKKNIAKDLFKDLIDKRWVFDVELFYKIKKKKYKLYYLPITWKHVEGSQVNVIKDSIVWFMRLLRLRFKLK
ncbi:dolichyl-phosphate beta-glucosyltransferase [Nanoarchaeota archaeon]